MNWMQQLTEANVNWDRLDERTIVVYTSGYKTADMHEIEQYLSRHGLICMAQVWDNIGGCTHAFYRERAKK